MSNRARMDTLVKVEDTQDDATEVGDELSCSNKHIWVGTSNQARDNMVGVRNERVCFRSSRLCLLRWKNLGNHTQQVVATRYKEKKLKRRKSRDGAFEDMQTINKQRSSWYEWFETRLPVHQGDLGHCWS